MWLIFAILVVGAALTTYAVVERRINQRRCPECGFGVSKDGLDEDCPRCDAIIPRYDGS
jgi:rubrerythrin